MPNGKIGTTRIMAHLHSFKGKLGSEEFSH